MTTRTARRKAKRAVIDRAHQSAPTSDRGSTWPLRAMAAALGALGIVPMANLVATGSGVVWWDRAVLEWAILTAIVALLAVALARFLPRQLDALASRFDTITLAPSPRVFAAGVGFVATLLALTFGWYLFHWLPVSGDEFSQLWQARLLTVGRLFIRPEVRSEFFSTNETLAGGGRWFSQFPIGGAAVLALGLLVRSPWIVNPVLTGITVIATYGFAAKTLDERTARRTAILLALSPFFLFMGGSMMNHTPTLAGVMMALAALAAWYTAPESRARSAAAAVIGASLGLTATIRPFDAAIAGAGIGIFQLHAVLQRAELRRSLLLQLMVGAVPVVGLLVVNAATVGAPLRFAYDALNGPEHRPGFHMSPLGFEHTPRRGIYNVSAYLMRLNGAMMGWPVPIMLFLVASLALQRTATRWDRLLVGILAATLAGYVSYWAESYYLGPRFLYTTLPILVLFVARCPATLQERLRSNTLRRAAGAVVPLCLAIAWVAPPLEGRMTGVWTQTKAYKVRGSEAEKLHADARRNVPSRALVFVDDGWHARLTARLRAVGVRPLIAERFVSSADACTVQLTLDGAERLGLDASRTAAEVWNAAERDGQASPVPGLSNSEALSFVPGRSLPDQCQRELRRSSGGVTMAELLPYEPISADGRLDGAIVYARDFGPRDELLRTRFGDRPWFVAHRREYGGRVEFRFVPYQRLVP